MLCGLSGSGRRRSCRGSGFLVRRGQSNSRRRWVIALEVIPAPAGRPELAVFCHRYLSSSERHAVRRSCCCAVILWPGPPTTVRFALHVPRIKSDWQKFLAGMQGSAYPALSTSKGKNALRPEHERNEKVAAIAHQLACQPNEGDPDENDGNGDQHPVLERDTPVPAIKNHGMARSW